MMRSACTFLGAAVLAATLTACGGGGRPAPDEGGDPPIENTEADFVTFVKARLDETSDATSPVSLEGVVFQDLALDDPDAFNDVLPTAP
jgi:hypothetical protein